MKESQLFTPVKIGPLTLRNRTIRAAAFEGHVFRQRSYRSVVRLSPKRGARRYRHDYARVCIRDARRLSFPHQLWLRPEVVPGLRRITDAIHSEGAAASIQIGHCGNMSHRAICGCRPVSASSGVNIYSPTLVRGLRRDEITERPKPSATRWLAREAGFDAVEVHAGHGYLISQFLRRIRTGAGMSTAVRSGTGCGSCVCVWTR